MGCLSGWQLALMRHSQKNFNRGGRTVDLIGLHVLIEMVGVWASNHRLIIIPVVMVLFIVIMVWQIKIELDGGGNQ